MRMLPWVTRLILWVLLSLEIPEASAEDALVDVQRLIQNFKVELQHTLEGARIRRRRQTAFTETSSDIGGFTAEHMKIGTSSPEELPYLQDNLTMWTSAEFHEQLHVFVGTSKGDYALLQMTEDKDNAELIAFSSGEYVGQKTKAFLFTGKQWFVVLQYNGDVTWIQMYERVGRGLERRQKIAVQGDSDFELIMVRGVYYLIVTYQTRLNKTSSHQGELLLYQWMNTQFDLISSRKTHGASSIACWSIDGVLYMTVSQEIDDTGNIHLGSPVFIFNARDDNRLVLINKLITNGPKKVSYFFVNGNRYLIFIGREDAEIYWWANDQFLLWQTIGGTANATDVAALALRNGEAILSIAFRERIIFLSLDVSGHYIVSFTMQFYGYSLSSMQFMFNGKFFYALVSSMPSAAVRPSPVWKLTLDSYSLPTLASVDPLTQCLNSLKDTTIERRNEIEAVQLDLDRVWMTNKNQVVKAPVIIQGTITSPKKNIIVDQIIISSSQMVDVTPLQLEENTTDLIVSKQLAEDALQDVVFKSGSQDINGTIFFMNGVIVPSLSIPMTRTDIAINGMSIARLAMHALKRSGNQIFNEAVQLDNLSAHSVLVPAINGVNINDLVLLDGAYDITGQWQFIDVQFSELKTSIVNSIPLSSLVLRDSPQNITGLKSFNHLKADSISVDYQTNGNYLREIAEEVVTLDMDQTIFGQINLQSETTVLGNMYITEPINGMVDLSALDAHAVRRHSDEVISGEKVFLSDVLVSGNVEGLLNGVDLDKDLLTLSTKQSISADITFSSDVSFGGVVSNSINGVNFNDDVVLRGRDELIEGHKTFSSLLDAEDMELLELATINGLDVSVLADSAMRHVDGVVEASASVLDNAVVLGNLTAMLGVNGCQISDLPEKVWLKSVPQNVVAPINVHGSVLFMNNVDAALVNGLNLTSDVVHVMGDEAISSSVTFASRVHIAESIEVAEGKLFAGVDLSAFRDMVNPNNLYEDDVIRGMKTFESLEVDGNIISDSINSLNFFTDIMLLDAPQTIHGDVGFESILLRNQNLFARNIDVDMWNDLPFKEFANSVVYKKQSSERPISNKSFASIRALEMSLSGNSEIDDVPFLEMLSETVTLNSPQVINATKKFLRPVHFESSVVAATVNGLDLQSHVDSVIFTEEETTILGKKTFTSDVSVVNVTANWVNGFNLSALATNVFSKTKDNDVFNAVVFKSDVDIGSLYLNESASIDGMFLSDLISTKDDVVFDQSIVFTTNISVGDIFVSGLVNGCPISDVSTHGLRTFDDNAQTVSGKVSLRHLTIEGKANFEDLVNGVSVQHLKNVLIGENGYQVIVGDFHMHPGFFAENFKLSGSINGVDLGFVMQNAVMKSTDQTITAKMVFQNDLEVDVLTGDINLLAERLNDIDLNELFQKAVLKTGFQVIEGDKVFRNFNALNVTVYEYLNGLRLPSDVILSKDQEEIPETVVIMKDVEIYSDLFADGKIDGVDFRDIRDVVTLSGNETITSDFTFLNDIAITGDLHVDGTVNDILLEMAVTVSGDQQINGVKVFEESLDVDGHVNAALVNEIDVNELAQQAVRRNANATLIQQTFTQPIYIQDSLSVDYVNGISIDSLLETFDENSRTLNASLTFLEGLNEERNRALSLRMKAVEDQTSSLAFFVLHQEINIDSANRILLGFSENFERTSLTMVMWTSERKCLEPSRCCDYDNSYWLTVDNMVTLSVDVAPSTGRYFPIVPVNSGQAVYRKKNALWSNSTFMMPNWCYLTDQVTVIGAFDETRSMVTYLELVDHAMLTDIRSFRDGYVYVVATYFHDSKTGEFSPTVVYRGHESTNEWNEYQILSTYGGLSMDLIFFTPARREQAEVLLAVGSGMGLYPDSYSSVYQWNTDKKSFDLVQNIMSQYVASILWIAKGSELLLAVANIDTWFASDVQCGPSVQGGDVIIYRYQDELQLIQTLDTPAVVSMVTFEISGETYLAAASRQLQTVTLYHWQGYSQFRNVQSFQARDVRHLNVFWRNQQLFMSVASGTGPSRILKAIVRGQSNDIFGEKKPDRKELEDPKNNEQGDQPSKDKTTSC